MLTYKEAVAKADEINKSLSAYDFSSSQCVHVETDEGFEAIIPSAFALKCDDWILILAEHLNPFVFHIDDVQYCYEMTVTKHQNALPKVEDFIPNPRGQQKCRKPDPKSH